MIAENVMLRRRLNAVDKNDKIQTAIYCGLATFVIMTTSALIRRKTSGNDKKDSGNK